MEKNEGREAMRSWSHFTNPIIESLFQKCNKDKDLTIFLRDDYLSVYCCGFVFAKIYPYGIEEPKSYAENPAALLDDCNFSKHKEKVCSGMPADKERRSQHKIALRNQDEPTDLIICDFEFKLPECYIENKQPELDLLAIDLSDIDRPRPVLIEYKRTLGALKGVAGVEAHYNDFKKIDKSMFVKKAIAEGAMCSFNFLVEIGRIRAKPITSIDPNGFWFSFLFSDLAVKDYYGYLCKILRGELPFRVAAFEHDVDVVINTGEFSGAKDFLLDNVNYMSSKNRYKLD